MLECLYCGGLSSLDRSLERTGTVSDSDSKSVAEWIARVVERDEQAHAAQVLAPLLDKPALPALIEAVTAKTRGLAADGRSWAAILLGRIQNRAAVPALIEAAKHSNILACHALGSLGGKAAISFLTEFSRSKTGDNAEYYAKMLIPAYERESSIPLLVAGMQNPHSKVRAAVAELLSVQIAESGGNSSSADRTLAIQSLEVSLSDVASEVRCACARALANIGAKESIPALLQAGIREAEALAADPHRLAYERISLGKAVRILAGDDADRIMDEAESNLRTKLKPKPKASWWQRG